jgi:hypothetical protein
MGYRNKTGLLILFIIMVSTCLPPGLRAAPTPSGRKVVFFYSNDVHGETEPCG